MPEATGIELLKITMDHVNTLIAANGCNICLEDQVIEMVHLLQVANQKLAESKIEPD